MSEKAQQMQCSTFSMKMNTSSEQQKSKRPKEHSKNKVRIGNFEGSIQCINIFQFVAVVVVVDRSAEKGV